MAPKHGSSKSGRSKGPYRVFVSHATKDKAIARDICEHIELTTTAITFRDDRDIDSGEQIDKVIEKQIRAVDEVVVLLTATGRQRFWIGMEVGMAVILKKRIVPIWYNTRVSSISFLATRKGYLFDQIADYLAALRERVEEKRR
ncbi:MAG TPA: toll/interleukin-1 receptor domain-containing protein [Gemmataceae bacterium]|jgi:hypothetical protein|nr:toll/interleukin-1 receptor domain-containing protein [Gemmataceae bacterium]